MNETIDPELLVFQRDASWWQHPSTNGGKYHLPTAKPILPACGLPIMLQATHGDRIKDVPANLLCKRCFRTPTSLNMQTEETKS